MKTKMRKFYIWKNSFNKIKFTNLLLIISVTLICNSLFAEGVVDQSHTQGQTTGSWMSTGAKQSFKVGKAGKLYRLRIHTQTYGTTASNISVKLYKGVMNGSYQIQQSWNYSKASYQYNWDELLLPSPCDVAVGDDFFIEIEANSLVDWMRSADNTNPYLNGYGNRSGVTNFDYNFETYVSIAPCGVTLDSFSDTLAPLTTSPSLNLITTDPGIWYTNGTGTFSNNRDPLATYTPSCADNGILVNLNWTNYCDNSTTQRLARVYYPEFTVTGANSICSGASSNVSLSGASSYSWSPTTGVTALSSAQYSLAPSSTITYSVTGTYANGCTKTKSQTLTVNNLPTVSLK